MLVRHASRRVARPLASYARAMSTTKYRTTRGAQKDVDFASAVLQGLGADGGLFVPQDLPKISAAELESWRSATYEDVAYGVMSKYITEDVMPAAKLKDIIKRSYGTFRPPSDDPITPGDHTDGKHGRVTPVRELPGDNMHVLELYHGPTFAFKDVALQFLGNLFEALLEDRPGMRITVLGATSGDTGSSAIHGLRGKKNVECFIMYPEGRTSRTQELQMITVTDPNIHNIALGGTFDDCQAVVKACFNDAAFREAHSLAAVNSINWARILAQMVYYVYAYLRVTKPAPAGAPAPKVSFSVPTGNFGDILAGYYAKRMGLPVDQMVVATNRNDILDRFFTKGDYSLSPNGVAETITPSMDIGISSNFERFLFHRLGENTDEMAALMKVRAMCPASRHLPHVHASLHPPSPPLPLPPRRTSSRRATSSRRRRSSRRRVRRWTRRPSPTRRSSRRSPTCTKRATATRSTRTRRSAWPPRGRRGSRTRPTCR